MGKMKIWFDEEGDFLEIGTQARKGFFRDLGNDVWQRVDEEGNVIGFAILHFRKRFKDLKAEEFELPVEIVLS